MLPSRWVWVPVIWHPSILSLLITNYQFSTCCFHRISFGMWMKTYRICFYFLAHFISCTVFPLHPCSCKWWDLSPSMRLILNHRTWLIEIWLLQVTLKLGQCVLCRAWVPGSLSGPCNYYLPDFGGGVVVAILNLWLERKFCHWRSGLSLVNDWTGSQFTQLLSLLFPPPVTSAPVFYRTVKFYLLIHTILTSPLEVEGRTDLSQIL